MDTVDYEDIIAASTDPSAVYVKLRDSFNTDPPDATRRPMFQLTSLETLKSELRKRSSSRRGLERIEHIQNAGLPLGTQIKSYLDIGTSDGEITLAVAESYDVDNVYGADVFSPENFKGAEIVQYRQVTDNRINLPDSSVQLATAFVSMHHFSDFPAMMTEILRILAPGGYFFFREHDVPPGDDTLVAYLDKMHEQWPDHMEGDTHYMDRAELRKQLVEVYQLEHIGDSDYVGKNPQKLYHSVFRKSGPKLSVTETVSTVGLSPESKLEFRKLDSMKVSYGIMKNFSKLRSAVNPYEAIPFPILSGQKTIRAGLKLANTDAVYGITQHRTGYLAPHSKGQLIFADLAGGPGGFSQYILWRDPDSRGMGITLRDNTADSSVNWDRRYLDFSRFTVENGDDGTGNLYTNTRSFPDNFLRTFPEGADLVVSDGGFDVSGKEEDQERLSSRLILTEVLVAIRILKEGNSVFVCKVFDTITLFMAQLLYLCANVFDEIDLFKPIASRPANSERYLVCSGFKRTKAPEVDYILDLANQAYDGESEPISLIGNDLPDDFMEWLRTRNRESIQLQLTTGNKILKLNSATPEGSRKLPEIPPAPVSASRALIIWNLPGGPDMRA